MYNLDIPLYINISMGAKVTGNPRCLQAFAWGAKNGQDFKITSSCFLSLWNLPLELW